MRKTKDKQLRTNILKLVANRIKPTESSIHYCRTSCNSCLIKIPQSHTNQINISMTMNNVQGQCVSFRKRNNFSIYGQIFEMTITGQQKVQQKQIGSPRKMLKLISKKLSQQNTEKRQQQKPNYPLQAVKKMINEWVNFTLHKSRKSPFEQQIHKQNLPLEQQPDLRILKQKIIQAFDLRVFQTKDSKLSYSQSINSSVFKKSIKAPPMLFDSSPESAHNSEHKQGSHKLILQHSQSPPKQFKLMPSRQQSGSLKMLKSVSTIASQKNIIKMGQQSYDELMRMLHIQALTIEQTLQQNR